MTRFRLPASVSRTYGLGTAVLIAATIVASPFAHAAGGDPFRGISETINTNAKSWASALICIGLFGVCIRYYFGDSDASQHTRNFLWGSIAAIAAGLGLAVYSWVSGFVQIQ
jgi:hypothetical protein